LKNTQRNFKGKIAINLDSEKFVHGKHFIPFSKHIRKLSNNAFADSLLSIVIEDLMEFNPFGDFLYWIFVEIFYVVTFSARSISVVQWKRFNVTD
jgi:hypothetical protein